MGVIDTIRTGLSKAIAPKQEKAIGGNWQTVGTVVPPGDSFLHFLSIATEEDYPQYIRITDPYLDNAWVFACVDQMQMNLAQAPLTLMRGDELVDRGGSDHWMWSLFNNVSPYMNKFTLVSSILTFLASRGECFWRIRRNLATDIPVRIDVVNPDQMEAVIRDEELVGWKRMNEIGKIESIEKEDIIQFKYFNPYNKFRGMSPLTASLLGLHIDYAAAAYNYYFFNNQATPSMILTTEQELTDEEADAVLAKFNKKHRGLQRSGKTSILSRGAKAQQVAMSQRDIDYIAQRKWSREEVFAVLGVPPALAQVLEHASIKSNIKEQRKQFFENNLIPKAVFFEDVLRTDFFERLGYPDYSLKFDFSQVSALQTENSEKVKNTLYLTKAGFTRNEINEMLELGFEERPWGDAWWVPSGMNPITDKTDLENYRQVIPDQLAGNNAPAPPEKRKKQSLTERMKASYVRESDRLERSFAKDIRSYVYTLRQEVITNAMDKEGYKDIDPTAMSYDILFDVEKANEKLVAMATPHFRNAYEAGIATLPDLGVEYGLTSPRAVASVHARVEALKEVNVTIAKQLQEHIEPILERGIEQGLNYEAVAGEIVDETRHIMNNARSRAGTIARTEINAVMNQSRFDLMEESGTEHHKWICTFHNSRESHIILDSQVRKVGDDFKLGLPHPHAIGAPAEEVVNCNCFTVPVLAEEAS